METKDIPTTEAPSDWQPTTDKAVLAVIGKLGEEAAELAKICFRIIIQGIDERDPATGKINRDALAEEMADVDALCMIGIHHLDLDSNAIIARSDLKREYKQPWINALIEQRGKYTNIEREVDGWYFLDETEDRHGPYRNKEVAEAQLALYCDFLEHGPGPSMGQQGHL